MGYYMRKNFVLDTNILIFDPKAIFKFQDNNLYIPIYVIEELDKLKSEHSLRGKNAREACRILDEQRCSGNLSQGVDLENEGKLFVYVAKKRKIIDVGLDKSSIDNAILQSALEIKEDYQNINTILVTMDVNLRVRADTLNLQTAAYESQSVDPSSLITGLEEIDVRPGEIDRLYSRGYFIPYEEHEGILYDNACVMLKDGMKTGLGRYDKENDKILKVEDRSKHGVMGIKPRNREQHFALDLLMNDNIKLVTIIGIAGTGKTLMSCAAGIQKVIDGTYSKLIISRPVVPMGKDLGFLPGDLNEKMSPWMQPIYDNLELLMMQGGGKKKGFNYNDILEQGLIKVEPLTYIRGRSLPSQFIIVDEAQNLSSHEIKTIITRCGEGSKIILTGDPDQIDSPYMDKGTCGLSLAIEKLHDNPLVGHLTLTKGERSPLANLAAERL
jgi:PhoH-like ATPase